MTILRTKTQTLQAWQYPGEMALRHWPAWVQSATRWHGSELILKRQTGDQIVVASEWLLKHPDQRDLLWVTDAECRRDYEVVA